MAKLNLSCLGSFQSTLEGEPIRNFGTDKVRALLIYLAIEADRPHRREFLASLFWPDLSEERASHNFRQALATLRKALKDEYENVGERQPFLLISRNTVQFNIHSDHWLDVRVFDQLLDRGMASHHHKPKSGRVNIRRLQQAIELYRGHFLDGLVLDSGPAFEEWLILMREALVSKALITLNLLIEYQERRGNYHQARQLASQMVALAPWEESARFELMRLLAQDGQWSAAAAQYHACRRYLMDELALEPSPETTHFFEKIRGLAAQNQTLSPRFSICPNNLPRNSIPFIGRENDLNTLSDLLFEPNCHLLTLLGPGGIGKTCLALEVANQHLGIFEDGVFFIPLDTAQITHQIIPLVGAALGISFSEQPSPIERLRQFLQPKNLLLVLDGVERVAQPTQLFLSEILPACPNLTVLVTSQERLNLHEEQIYEVKGLDFPQESDDLIAGEAKQFDAVWLFLEKVQQIKRDFTPSQQELRAIVTICNILEGHPLGIELAAAVVWSQSCQEIATELSENLDILISQKINIPDRHRSLRAVFDHSVSFLSPVEKKLFVSLGVFPNGFDPTAIKEIAKIDRNTLAAFLDKSLVYKDETGRYKMHSLVRSFAEEKLNQDVNLLEQTQKCFIQYYIAFIQRQGEIMSGSGQQNAIFDLALDFENWQQACLWAAQRNLTHEIESCLDTLYYYFEIHSRFQEGLQLLGQILELLPHDPSTKLFPLLLARQAALDYRIANYNQAESNLLQAMQILDEKEDAAEFAFCLVKQASITSRRGELEKATHLAQKGLLLAEKVNDLKTIGIALYQLGLIEYRSGNANEAQEFLQTSQTASEESGDKRLWGEAANLLGDIACHQGNYDLAKQLFEENLGLYQALGDRMNAAVVLNNLGTIWHVQKDYEQAQRAYYQSLTIAREIGDQPQMAIVLSNLGELAQIQNNFLEARQHYEQGLRIGQLINNPWVVMACLNNLAEVSCIQSECRQAEIFLNQALEIALETQTTTMLVKVLVNLGVYFEKTGKPNLAAELWMLASQHPAAELDIQNKAADNLASLNLSDPHIMPRSLEELLPVLFTALGSNSHN